MAARRQECSICRDVFKDPKLLPCHHSFCHKCLDDYVKANLSNGRFNCALCRTSVALPAGGVSAFQTNFYIDTSEKTFCDQHQDDEIKLFCQECKTLICARCVSVNHDRHSIQHVSDAAAEVRKEIKIKKNECSDKVRRITDSEREVEALDRKIDDAERKEIKALEDQRLQLIKIIDQEVAKMKEQIRNVYKDLKRQNASLRKEIQEKLKTCSIANDNAKKITDQGTDIDLLKKVPYLELLFSTVMAGTLQKPMTRIDKDLFCPGKINIEELTSLIGMIRDSTKMSLDGDKKGGAIMNKVQNTARQMEVDETEKNAKQRNQIQAFRSSFYGQNLVSLSDENLVRRMCPNCQGWTEFPRGREVGFDCTCGATK